MSFSISRRRFAGTVAAAVGGSLLGPFRSVARASLSRGEPETFIQLNSNENPYGPSPRALEALSRSSRVAGRYPDASEEEVREAIARHHRVTTKQIVLGCGSSDILRMADSAFVAPGKTVVAAEPTFEAVLLHARVTRAEAVRVPLTPDFRHDLTAHGIRMRWQDGPRLCLQSQQPDRDGRRRRGALLLPRPGAGRSSGSRRRGLPPLRRGPRVPHARSNSSAVFRRSSSRGPSPRSTGWRECGWDTRWPRKPTPSFSDPGPPGTT